MLLAIGAGPWLRRQTTAPSGSASLPVFEAQGHRGARGLYPENSLPGFAAALAIGVTTLEMDVGMTGDGVLVVHHDRRLDPERARDPDGDWLDGPPPALFELPSAALAAYDIGRLRPGSRAAARFPRQAGMDAVAIPTLAEVIARAEAASNGSIRYNIEIKTAPDAPDKTAAPETMAETLLAVVETTGTADRTAIQSFDWRSLRRVQEIAPGIPTVYLTAEQSWLDNVQRGQSGVSPWTAGFDVDAFGGSLPRAIKAAGGSVWSPYYRDLRDADLAEAKRLGLRVVVWTVDEPADMRRLMESGVDGIVSDFPDRLRAMMSERGIPLPPAFPAAEGN